MAAINAGRHRGRRQEANELAPGRFTWRKYKDQINLEVVRVYLSDAKKKAKGAYLIGSGNSGWTLSEAGLAFAREHVDEVERSAARGHVKRWARIASGCSASAHG